MNIKLVVAALAGAVLLSGCCTVCRQHTKNAKPLENTEWHLVQIEGRDVTPDADTFNITLKEGNLTGIGACNRLMGSYTLSQKKGLIFGYTASTRMMCRNMEEESRFCAILDQTTHYDIDGDALMLICNGTIKAVLKAK